MHDELTDKLPRVQTIGLRRTVVVTLHHCDERGTEVSYATEFRVGSARPISEVLERLLAEVTRTDTSERLRLDFFAIYLAVTKCQRVELVNTWSEYRVTLNDGAVVRTAGGAL